MITPTLPHTVEAARYYIARGWSVVPLPPREKAPNIPAWQKRDFGSLDFPTLRISV